MTASGRFVPSIFLIGYSSEGIIRFVHFNSSIFKYVTSHMFPGRRQFSMLREQSVWMFQYIKRTKSNEIENSAVTLISVEVVVQVCFTKLSQYFAVYINVSIHCKCCKLFSVNNNNRSVT